MGFKLDQTRVKIILYHKVSIFKGHKIDILHKDIDQNLFLFLFCINYFLNIFK